jgi:hypothetical protein
MPSDQAFREWLAEHVQRLGRLRTTRQIAFLGRERARAVAAEDDARVEQLDAEIARLEARWR